MNVLVVDVGGTHIKLLATGQSEPRKFVSGPTLTAERMVAGVDQLATDWTYDVVAIGYPGPVLHGRPVAEPATTPMPSCEGSAFGRKGMMADLRPVSYTHLRAHET